MISKRGKKRKEKNEKVNEKNLRQKIGFELFRRQTIYLLPPRAFYFTLRHRFSSRRRRVVLKKRETRAMRAARCAHTADEAMPTIFGQLDDDAGLPAATAELAGTDKVRGDVIAPKSALLLRYFWPTSRCLR